MRSFYGIKEKDLQDELVSLGYSKFSSSQIFDWVYRKKVKDFNLMSNIKKELQPLLQKGVWFEEKESINFVVKELQKLLTLTIDEQNYQKEFSKGNYNPSLLFDKDIGEKLCQHPMAKWRIQNLV